MTACRSATRSIWVAATSSDRDQGAPTRRPRGAFAPRGFCSAGPKLGPGVSAARSARRPENPGRVLHLRLGRRTRVAGYGTRRSVLRSLPTRGSLEDESVWGGDARRRAASSRSVHPRRAPGSEPEPARGGRMYAGAALGAVALRDQLDRARPGASQHRSDRRALARAAHRSRRDHRSRRTRPGRATGNGRSLPRAAGGQSRRAVLGRSFSRGGGALRDATWRPAGGRHGLRRRNKSSARHLRAAPRSLPAATRVATCGAGLRRASDRSRSAASGAPVGGLHGAVRHLP